MKKINSVIIAIIFTVSCFTMHAKNLKFTINFNGYISDTTKLIEFKGKYVFTSPSPIADVLVAIDKENLVAISTQGVFNLKAVEGKNDFFTIEDLNAEVVFVRDENKKITGFTAKTEDGTLVAKKEEIK